MGGDGRREGEDEKRREKEGKSVSAPKEVEVGYRAEQKVLGLSLPVKVELYMVLLYPSRGRH
jgi:hypothetical protein